MDYETNYKHARLIAESRLKTEDDDTVVTFIHLMFPELRESEDERIRKELLRFIEAIERIALEGRTSMAIRKSDIAMCERFIPYIEKQKEQEQGKRLMLEDAVEAPLFRVGDFLAIDLNMEELGYTEKDKVKVIIVKKEDEK